MSRFAPPSEEELAARGIGTVKVRAQKKDGTLQADDSSTEEKPAKKRGRPAKKKD